jgi:hypothetical protein
MRYRPTIAVICVALACGANPSAMSQQTPPPKGFHSFGADQTIVDISNVEWTPLQFQGLPAGIEMAVLRGDLAKVVVRFCCGHRRATWSQITATRVTRSMSG